MLTQEHEHRASKSIGQKPRFSIGRNTQASETIYWSREHPRQHVQKQRLKVEKMHSKTYLGVVCTVASMSALFVLHADSILSAHWRLESSNCKPRISRTATNLSERHVQLARNFFRRLPQICLTAVLEILDLQTENSRLKPIFQALVSRCPRLQWWELRAVQIEDSQG